VLTLAVCLRDAAFVVRGECPSLAHRDRASRIHVRNAPVCCFRTCHELGQYSALSHHGYVTVRWPQLDGSIVFAWEERSESIETKASDGFGNRLMEIAVKQLEGTLTPDW
jgi:hypothetical protein